MKNLKRFSNTNESQTSKFLKYEKKKKDQKRLVINSLKKYYLINAAISFFAKDISFLVPP